MATETEKLRDALREVSDAQARTERLRALYVRLGDHEVDARLLLDKAAKERMHDTPMPDDQFAHELEVLVEKSQAALDEQNVLELSGDELAIDLGGATRQLLDATEDLRIRLATLRERVLAEWTRVDVG